MLRPPDRRERFAHALRNVSPAPRARRTAAACVTNHRAHTQPWWRAGDERLLGRHHRRARRVNPGTAGVLAEGEKSGRDGRGSGRKVLPITTSSSPQIADGFVAFE